MQGISLMWKLLKIKFNNVFLEKVRKMELEKFKKALDTIRDFDKTITAIEDLNIGMINSNICADFWALQELFFSEVYTKEGYEWITYYIYEIPLLEEKAKKNGESTNGGWAKDENGIIIDLSSDEALWNFLENNYSSLKESCSAINN